MEEEGEDEAEQEGEEEQDEMPSFIVLDCSKVTNVSDAATYQAILTRSEVDPRFWRQTTWNLCGEKNQDVLYVVKGLVSFCFFNCTHMSGGNYLKIELSHFFCRQWVRHCFYIGR